MAEPGLAGDEKTDAAPESGTAPDLDQPAQKLAPRRRGKPKVAPDTPRTLWQLDLTAANDRGTTLACPICSP
ncbi:hypothetical protein [uncultured Rhodospira sp.]|uniref:hypothetical protein n=1 Tax=uncultured Rhodospira sp. TaxID=1936189 RepID=UPI002614587B|nr:hypothetical protein [uncultured Rhodospira sp.]